MALLVKKGAFAKSVGGAPASQSIIDVGFEPKALILWATAQTSEGIAAGYQLAFGFTDGSDDRGICWTSEDNQPASDTDRRFAVKVLSILDFTQTVLAECDLTSFDAGGFTLNWTTNDGNTYIIHYFAIGGDDLTDAKADHFNASVAGGPQAVAGVGFQPDVVLFLTLGVAADPPVQGSTIFGCLGMAVSASEQGLLAPDSFNGQTPSDAERYQRTNKCVGAVLLGGVTSEAEFVSMDPDGFTIDWTNAPGGAIRIGYLAIKGGQYYVGSETQRASTGTKATAGVGFQPTGLLIEGFNRTASAAVEDHNRISIGAASVGDEGCTWVGDTDAVNPTSADMSTQTDKILRHIDTDAPVAADAEADLDSFDADGFTLDWTTADAVAREFLFLAMGSEPAPPGGDEFGEVGEAVGATHIQPARVVAY